MAANAIVDLYERHAQSWVRARQREASLYEKGWLDRFCGLLPARGSVLDIGCGAGVPISVYLAARRFSVVGVDSSPAMIAMFRARLPEQAALVQDMRRLAIGRKFDGILAWDSFFHLCHDDQAKMFAVFRAHAACGAALMFTSGPGQGEVLGDLEGEPLYHASLDGEAYRQLLDAHGFDVVAHVIQDETCRGRTVWLARFR